MPHASVPPLSARSGGPDVSVRLVQLVRNSEGTISVSLDVERAAAGACTAEIRPIPDWTATRERRATVALDRLETLWINTGTLCNITCQNCYIESSPSNDRLVYITAAEAAAYFDEIEAGGLGTREIGFTGGEPFMNPQLLAMVEDALRRGFEVLVLSNAMQPMQRPKVKRGPARARQALRRAPDDPRQPRPLHEGPARGRARRPHLGAHARRSRLADRERPEGGDRGPHLLERGRGGRRAPATARLIAEHGWRDRCRPTRPSSCCCRRWTASTTCRRSPRAAGPS